MSGARYLSDLSVEAPKAHCTIEMQGCQRATFATKRDACDAVTAVDSSPGLLAFQIHDWRIVKCNSEFAGLGNRSRTRGEGPTRQLLPKMAGKNSHVWLDEMSAAHSF
jgi:hypothetical protein